MLLIVVLYNLGLAAVVAWLLWRLRRSQKPIRTLLASALIAGGAAAAGALLAPVHLFGKMQLAAWGALLHAPLLLLGAGVICLPRRRFPAAVCLLLGLALAAVAVDAVWIEPRALEVTHVTLPAAGLARPVRVALVADLQTDDPSEYEERALRAVMAEKPDLILLAGDYIQLGDEEQYARAGERLREIFRTADVNAPLGVWAVQGNLEYRGDWPKLFANLPVRTFAGRSETVDLGPLRLTGLTLSDSWVPGRAAAALAEGPGAAQPATRPAAPAKFHIALGHCPDFAMARPAADLLLAGHTHGGQVQMPFVGPILTFSRVPRSWAAGRTELGDGKTLIVSRGVGLERGGAPRVRFWCRPEVVIIDLAPR